MQQARKDRDLDVTDRIALRLSLSERLAKAVTANEDDLAAATLARSVTYVGRRRSRRDGRDGRDGRR